VIELQSLRLRWPGAGHDTLDIPAWSLAGGRSVFVHGPSGCGKSTLLGLLAGVLVASAGRVSVLGVDLATIGAADRDALRATSMGVIFQQFNLLPYLNLLDNVRLPCRFSAERAARAARQHGSVRACAEALLAQMELPRETWRRPAATLSVGQQQRVAAARALIGTPPLVIADEPTSALDAALREHFVELLLARCREAGSTLVFVSHDERLAGRFDERQSLPALNRAPQEPPA
jgi:putative ABC transport system ATP-binding protein